MSTVYLGDFGTKRDPIDATFGYFGRTIRVNPYAGPNDMIDFLEDAQAMSADDPRQVTMIKSLFRSLINADDFDLFWRTSRENFQQAEDLMRTYQQVLEGVTNRPSVPRSDSSPGPSTTEPVSRPGYSPAPAGREGALWEAAQIPEYQPNDENPAGRPDLALIAARAVEEREKTRLARPVWTPPARSTAGASTYAWPGLQGTG